jgi:tetratricopeptide (TPR) repeat protein
LAQAHLLKAAKADQTKASPFALLGYWYERANDPTRAVGCYSKALLLQPSHPVAGRGLLRLKGFDTMRTVIDKATSDVSPLTGWAWLSFGTHKAKVEGDDDLAVLSLVTALRCRDISSPSSDNLSYFYSDPHHPQVPGVSEYVSAEIELAGCYRREGRFTASIRCYELAIDAAGEAVTGSTLCACAQGQ